MQTGAVNRDKFAIARDTRVNPEACGLCNWEYRNNTNTEFDQLIFQNVPQFFDYLCDQIMSQLDKNATSGDFNFLDS